MPRRKAPKQLEDRNVQTAPVKKAKQMTMPTIDYQKLASEIIKQQGTSQLTNLSHLPPNDNPRESSNANHMENNPTVITPVLPCVPLENDQAVNKPQGASSESISQLVGRIFEGLKGEDYVSSSHLV